MLERDSVCLLLEVSDHNDPDKRCPELPSWFPNLRLRGLPFRLPFYRAAAAAGGSESSLQRCTFEDSNNLCVLGVSADVVEDKFPLKWYWPDHVQKLSGDLARLQWCRNCLELAGISKMRTGYCLLTLNPGILTESIIVNLTCIEVRPRIIQGRRSVA